MSEFGLSFARLATHIPPFRGIVREINHRVAEGGVSDASRFLLDKAHVRVNLKWDDQRRTEEILQTQPAIIVGNHPYMIEPLFIAYALPSREDLYAIARDGIGEVFGGLTRDHFLPVRRGRKREKPQARERRRKANADSITKGVQLLKEGHAVLILPDGGSSEQWRPGVARLAVNIPEAYFIMTDVQGTKRGDLGRLITGIFRRETSLERTIRISAPIKISDIPIPAEVFELPENERIEKITYCMQQYYRIWQRGEQITKDTPQGIEGLAAAA